MANGPGLPPATFDFKPALYRLTSGQKLYRIERGLKYVGKFNVVLFESRVHKSDLKFSRSPILIEDTIDIYDFAYRHGIWIN